MSFGLYTMDYFRQHGAENHDIGVAGKDVVHVDRTGQQTVIISWSIHKCFPQKRAAELILLLFCDFMCLQTSFLVCVVVLFSASKDVCKQNAITCVCLLPSECLITILIIFLSTSSLCHLSVPM